MLDCPSTIFVTTSFRIGSQAHGRWSTLHARDLCMYVYMLVRQTGSRDSQGPDADRVQRQTPPTPDPSDPPDHPDPPDPGSRQTSQTDRIQTDRVQTDRVQTDRVPKENTIKR